MLKDSNSTKGDVLMSRHNPKGWKLEDLLSKVAEEIESKSQMLMASTAGELSDLAIMNNLLMQQHLHKARAIQLQTMKAFSDRLGPDKGPKSPRIGG